MHDLDVGEYAPVFDDLYIRRARTIVTRRGIRRRGLIRSPKFPHHPLSWESPLERRLIKAAVLSPAFTAFRTQPATLELSGPDGGFDYTPDAVANVITYEEGGAATVFLECKPQAIADEPEVRQRFAAIRAGVGWPFVVITDHVLTEELETRLDLVYRHVRWAGGPKRPSAHDERALEAAHDFPTLGTFVDRMGGEHLAMHAISQGAAHLDYRLSITSTSRVYPQYHMERDPVASAIRDALWVPGEGLRLRFMQGGKQ
jgi:hypothetical protein